ncbi:MAG: hypothetical protein L0Y66_05075 [Myxococcaceae bacterium]|nr:hypothetical protein [Myxococcaceae bacterium]
MDVDVDGDVDEDVDEDVNSTDLRNALLVRVKKELLVGFERFVAMLTKLCR